MAKMPRQQDDLRRLLEIVSSKGMQITPEVKKSIKDLVKKELGDGTAMAKGGMVSKKSTGYNKGGMPMVMKDGKKVPAYAADGVGKMNKGGVAKKKPAAKMMGGGMSKSSGYMYGGMAKKKPAAKKK